MQVYKDPQIYWTFRYIVEEKVFYLAERHDVYGMLREYFFDNFCEYYHFRKESNLKKVWNLKQIAPNLYKFTK
tara:strand:+ start:462 stop:680 length:219 start_codon:yes stop_codon:yes gene_type:complete